jgi:hypothetical protein
LITKPGFVINGESAGDKSGISVSSAGDVNGDGLDDLIVGAYQADPSGKSSAGKSYSPSFDKSTASVSVLPKMTYDLPAFDLPLGSA